MFDPLPLMEVAVVVESGDPAPFDPEVCTVTSWPPLPAE
jgi:hypothetical protein